MGEVVFSVQSCSCNSCATDFEIFAICYKATFESFYTFFYACLVCAVSCSNILSCSIKLGDDNVSIL